MPQSRQAGPAGSLPRVFESNVVASVTGVRSPHTTAVERSARTRERPLSFPFIDGYDTPWIESSQFRSMPGVGPCPRKGGSLALPPMHSLCRSRSLANRAPEKPLSSRATPRTTPRLPTSAAEPITSSQCVWYRIRVDGVAGPAVPPLNGAPVSEPALQFNWPLFDSLAGPGRGALFRKPIAVGASLKYVAAPRGPS